MAGTIGVVPPINRYFLGSDLRVPRTTRLSVGVDQTLAKVVRAAVTYGSLRGERLARGLNLNAPVGGTHPDAAFANIVEVVSDARSRQHQLLVDASVNPGALMPAFKGPRVSWKRTTLFVNWASGTMKNNTDGHFGVSPTGVLDSEWGPAANDVRYRFNAAFNNQVIRNVLMSFMVNAASGAPYTVRTGSDDNGDGIFNDRPAGVGRNTLRMPNQVTMNMQLGYQFAFGRLATPLPPGIAVFGSGGAPTVRSVDLGAARYRIGVFVFIQNLTNRPNYIGFSGVLTSPFFGRPTSVSGMRKISVGLNFSF